MATTSPLTSSKTPGIIVAEIQMMRSTFSGNHFLVEGDDDSRFWKPRLSKTTVAVVACEGKPNLLGAATLISAQGIPGVVGVYDPDFERLLGVRHSPHMLTPTDGNDLEVTLLSSEAVELMLHEFADSALVQSFEQSQGLTAPEHVEQISAEFGKLRFLSGVFGHQVDFDRLSPYRFISADDWLLDRSSLLAEYSALASISQQSVETALQTHCVATARWAYSQGHDCVRILAQGLKRRIAKKQICEQDVAKILRISYSSEMLQRSSMYAYLKGLESALPEPLFA